MKTRKWPKCTLHELKYQHLYMGGVGYIDTARPIYRYNMSDI